MSEKKVCFSVIAATAMVMVAFLTGCRAYNDHVWRTVSFVTEPDRATVFINGKNCGVTPREERLDRRGTYEVRFSKPGFFDETVVLESFADKNGVSDILDSVNVRLEKVTPEGIAARTQSKSATGASAGSASVDVPAAENNLSSAAAEFENRGKPINFTEFRLREKELRRLFDAGKITEAEYTKLHDNLCESYNETRLLKAPRLGTYEQSR